MQLGAAMLHVDWLDGKNLGDWQFGVKLLCGRFPQVYKSLDERKISIGLFLDLSKAFDLFNHDILLIMTYC
jgi:hypothetical protein